MWVIHLSWGQFAGYTRKHSETAAPLPAGTLAVTKENAVSTLNVSFSRYLFLMTQTVSLGEAFCRAHKNISNRQKRMQSVLQKILFQVFFLDQADRRADLGHGTLCILKPENTCIGFFNTKVLIQIQGKLWPK